MVECEQCGRVLDHDFQDVGICQYCLDSGDPSEVDFSELVFHNNEDDEDY